MPESIYNQTNLTLPGNVNVGTNLFVQNNITPNANLTVAAPTGAAQTIATNTGFISRNAPAGACTGTILQAGTFNGQMCLVTNESTVVANTITFSTTLATGLVLTDAGPTAVVIKASSAKLFVWLTSLNGGNGAWIPIPPAAG